MTTKKTLFLALVPALALSLALAGSASADSCGSAKAHAHKDLVETAVAAGSFNTLAAALEAGGLVGALQGDGPFTVFAPTDEAFGKLPAGTVETLLKPENKAKLVAILKYHIVAGKVKSGEVARLSGAQTLNGQRVAFRMADQGVHVGSAKVLKADIHASNGVIHVIDSVLLPVDKTIPEIASSAGTFQTLLAAVKAAGLAETLMGKGPFTVFAPTDEAFAKLPAGTVESLLEPENRDQLVQILTYHVVATRIYSSDALKAGEATTLQGGSIAIKVEDGVPMAGHARLLKTDLDASNGVIHVIDSVLLPNSQQG